MAHGARGDGRTDDYRAIMTAAADASRRGCDLIFPAGVYVFDQTLELGLGGLRIFGRGKATLQYRGSGYAVSIDAGENAIHYHHHLENLLIIGDGSADQHGILIRNFVHGIRRALRVTNIGGIAFDIAGDVLSTYDHCRVADNETARSRTSPVVDFRIRGTRSVTATTACLFRNCMAERADAAGWQIDAADNCRWIGGTAEGLAGVGIRISPLSHGNVFESVFMEQNRGGDVICSGADTSFHDCTAMSRAVQSPYESVPSIKITSGTRGTTFSGGQAYSVLIEQGAHNSRIAYAQIMFRVDDAGQGTTVQGCRQGYRSDTSFPSQTLGNVDNPDPLALDWYREAPFVPALAGVGSKGLFAVDVRHADSTRIGNMVFLSLTIRIRTVRSQASGDLILDGLPYDASTASVLSVFVEGADAPADWHGVTRAGTRSIRLVADKDGRSRPVDAAMLRAGTELTISGQYRV